MGDSERKNMLIVIFLLSCTPIIYLVVFLFCFIKEQCMKYCERLNHYRFDDTSIDFETRSRGGSILEMTPTSRARTQYAYSMDNEPLLI